jgi:hypothetical protein
MRRWAILDNNKVIEITPNIESFTSNMIKIGVGVPCYLGWEFNGIDFDPPKWTAYQFLLRLTPEERADIRQRAATDPNVADFLMLCQSAQEIISNDPVTVMGMNYMVAIGVFTEQRKKEILQILE